MQRLCLAQPFVSHRAITGIWLTELAEQVARRLRWYSPKGRTVKLKVRFELPDGHSFADIVRTGKYLLRPRVRQFGPAPARCRLKGRSMDRDLAQTRRKSGAH